MADAGLYAALAAVTVGAVWLLGREQIGIWRYRRRVAKRLKDAERN